MSKPELRVHRLRPSASLPRRMSAQSAGYDLSACLDAPVRLDRGARALIPTGIALAISPGYEGQIRPRSGLALRDGISILNAPGTIDADYRGEVGVILINLGEEPFIVRHGDRIAQLVLSAVVLPELEEVSELPEAERGDGGFGSTGV
jgi:dUTP pyrophosphatase